MNLRIGRFIVPLVAKHQYIESHLEAIIDFPAFKQWVQRLSTQLSQSSATITVHQVTVTDLDLFGTDRIGFVKFNADIRWADGTKIPGIVFCRGPAVAVFLVIQSSDSSNDNQRWVVLVRQPRIPIATLDCLELPAGMMDDCDNFAGVAAKELQEECGIELKSTDLIDMTHRWPNSGLVPSGGGCDEFIKLFYCEKKLPWSIIQSLEGREGGLRDHGERIQVTLVKYEDVWRKTNDMKALASIALYERINN